MGLSDISGTATDGTAAEIVDIKLGAQQRAAERSRTHRRSAMADDVGSMPALSLDPNAVVGKLLLDGVGTFIQFSKTRILHGEKVAVFAWRNFPMLDAQGKFWNADLFIVDVSLSTRCMVRAQLESTPISASDALILVWFNTIFAAHVKEHAYGNWGVSPKRQRLLFSEDWEFARNSVTTVLYNYLGKTMFPRLAKLMFAFGLCRFDFRSINDILEHGIHSGVQAHGDVREILQYSPVAKFVVALRNYFLEDFGKCKADHFPGVNGEALFIGTVLHSLDHGLGELTLADPLWLDVESRMFGCMAEIGRIVRACFVADIPTVGVRKFFRDAVNPFYRRVYQHAWRLNPALADLLQTCIVK